MFFVNQVRQCDRGKRKTGTAPTLKPKSEISTRGTQPAVAWQPKRNLAKQEWVVVGKRLGGISRCNQWWLGDWVRYGVEKWGEKYTQAAKITGYDPRSLANMAYIAAAFKLSRRRDNLTWSHHVAVAALPEADQEVWLDRSVSESFSVADLRTELRAAPEKGRDAAAALHQAVEPQEREPEVFCPQCGYRLAQGDLG